MIDAGIVAGVLTTKGLKFLAQSAAKLGDGKELPNRLLIVPWGKTETIQGPIICNATTLRELPANQARRKRDRVALDFQHNTVEGSQFYKGEPAKVAAFASMEVVEGEGIYLSNIEWTPDGKAFAADGHYPDLSPAIITNDKGEVVLVHSAGLVRQGEIDGMTE
jgi:phage I-like protein